MRLGEADRIVTLATEGRGKVLAVVKGVRRTTSRWGGRLEPMSNVSVICWQGRDLDTVTQAQVLDQFISLRQDVDRIRRASVLLEVVDQVCQEDQPNPALYKMLVGALRAMETTDSPLITAGFVWKLLALEGSAPVLDACANCGRPEPLVAFDLADGGALCNSCRRGVPVSPGALDVLRHILGGELAAVLRKFPVRSPLASEIDHLSGQVIEAHLERRVRSLHVLEDA
jgi:DNA repair protein RecO (recombination protein O)